TSSSEPGCSIRNETCQRAAKTRPKTTTSFEKFGEENSSRIARRYATPATQSGMRKDASPMMLSLREQIVSDMSKTTPSPQSLCDAENFTNSPHRSGNVPEPLSTPSARQRFVVPSPERHAILLRGDPNRKPRRRRRKGPPDLQKAAGFERAPSELRGHSPCSVHRFRKERDGGLLPPRDSSRHPG